MARIDLFVQIIEGRTSDPEAVRRHHERWLEELAPDAQGWLGMTAGVSDDGEYVALVRFASREAARRNSERDEQDDWWQELVGHLDGEPEVHDCEDVAAIAGGGSDDAEFVQVFRGRASRLHGVLDEIAERGEQTLPHRPELIGGYLLAHSEGTGFTEVLYYPSEEAAEESRETREKELTRMEEIAGAVTELRRIDIADPWLHSA